jgi:hypothetical protein
MFSVNSNLLLTSNHRELGDAVGFGLSDPIIRMSINPPVDFLHEDGNQSQRTSQRVRTLNPVWDPPERFNFLITSDDRAKVIISA